MNSMQGFIEEQQQLEDGDPSLSSFLENIALSTDQDKKNENEDQVSLMTIHLSKGLEFPVVHLVGLEENLFPSFMSSSTREELEEERRLFYVALNPEPKNRCSFLIPFPDFNGVKLQMQNLPDFKRSRRRIYRILKSSG